MRPVPLPPIRPGQDARLVAAENRNAAIAANAGLEQSREWYEGVRESYMRGPR